MNALAKIHRTTNAGIEIEKVMDVGGFNLDHAMEVNPHFLEAGHHHHHHDDDVTSVGIQADGDCNGKKLNEWLSKTVREQGVDIFRMKGVFAIKGGPDRIVFQGVHMIIDAANGGPWADRPRRNTLVFIGRNLDRAALTSGFRSCLA
jgi:G3E family GTPase